MHMVTLPVQRVVYLVLGIPPPLNTEHFYFFVIDRYGNILLAIYLSQNDIAFENYKPLNLFYVLFRRHIGSGCGPCFNAWMTTTKG